MSTYFSGDIIKQPFEMFSTVHIITLAILFAANFFLTVWFKKSENKKALHTFGYILAGVLFLNELFYIGWSFMSGSWSIEYSLPLELCDAAAFLGTIMLISRSYSCFEVLYFWGLGGSLQALLTPDLAYPFPHCIYFSFFLGHGAILTAIFYMITAERFAPTLKSVLKAFIFTNVYMVIIAAANLITGGNYMFLRSKPQSSSIMDFLGPWPWYILSLEAVALVIFLLCYLPFGIKSILSKEKFR